MYAVHRNLIDGSSDASLKFELGSALLEPLINYNALNYNFFYREKNNILLLNIKNLQELQQKFNISYYTFINYKSTNINKLNRICYFTDSKYKQ